MSFAITDNAAPKRGLTAALFEQPCGWIGLDIGTQSVKLAQVARAGEDFEWLATYALPWQPETERTSAYGPFSPLKQPLRAAQKLFRGRDIACVLSMSMTEMRALEVPLDPAFDVGNVLPDEFAQEAGDPLQFAVWDVPDRASSETHWINAIAVRQTLAQQLAALFLSLGWDCRVIDAMPCALARAVRIEDRGSDAVSALLDFGYENCTLILAQGGRPLLTRQFRGINFHACLERLAAALGVTDDDARQLLARYGIDEARSTAPKVALANAQLLAPLLTGMARELRRTFNYVEQQLGRTMQPRQLLLTGGGSSLRGLNEYLQGEIELPVAAWLLPLPHARRDSLTRADAHFAAATAASVLRWEVIDAC